MRGSFLERWERGGAPRAGVEHEHNRFRGLIQEQARLASGELDLQPQRKRRDVLLLGPGPAREPRPAARRATRVRRRQAARPVGDERLSGEQWSRDVRLVAWRLERLGGRGRLDGPGSGNDSPLLRRGGTGSASGCAWLGSSRTTSVVAPISIVSATASVCGEEIRSPLTYVPLVEPRSSIAQKPLLSRATRAWAREISSSSASRPAPSAWRPIRSSSSTTIDIRRPCRRRPRDGPRVRPCADCIEPRVGEERISAAG